MRVWIGGVKTVVPARWFFCDDGAKFFSGEHGCEASPWLKSHEVNTDWGEIEGTKTLDRGVNPGYTGQCSHGDAQWFVDGKLPADIYTRIPDVCGGCGPFPGESGYIDQPIVDAINTLHLWGHFENGPACVLAAPAFRFIRMAFPALSAFIGPQVCGSIRSDQWGINFAHVPCGQTLILNIPDAASDAVTASCFDTDIQTGFVDYQLSYAQLSPFRLEFRGIKLLQGGTQLAPSAQCPGGTVTLVVEEGP